MWVYRNVRNKLYEVNNFAEQINQRGNRVMNATVPADIR